MIKNKFVLMKINDTREKEIYKTTLIGSLINFILLIFKFVAGFIGHSSAMIADAVHSLSDFITDIIVIIFVKISNKPQDEDHSYGHGKYETLATAIIGVALLAVGIGIVVNSTKEITSFISGKDIETPGILALIAAIISIIFKEALYRYTVFQGKRLNSKAVIANAWHHRSDALSSIGTLFGIGGAIFLGNNWKILDPIAALVVSALIIKTSIYLIKPCIEELLEKSLPKQQEKRIIDIILSFPEVSAPHHLRTRRIGNNIAIEIHIRMDGAMSLNDAHEVTKRIETAIKDEFGAATHIGIHMEPKKTEG